MSRQLYNKKCRKYIVKGTVSRDEPMEQLLRPNLMVVDPFFCFKIGRLKVTVCSKMPCHKNDIYHKNDICHHIFNVFKK
jgi:hypothetical protein